MPPSSPAPHSLRARPRHTRRARRRRLALPQHLVALDPTRPNLGITVQNSAQRGAGRPAGIQFGDPDVRDGVPGSKRAGLANVAACNHGGVRSTLVRTATTRSMGSGGPTTMKGARTTTTSPPTTATTQIAATGRPTRLRRASAGLAMTARGDPDLLAAATHVPAGRRGHRRLGSTGHRRLDDVANHGRTGETRTSAPTSDRRGGGGGDTMFGNAVANSPRAPGQRSRRGAPATTTSRAARSPHLIGGGAEPRLLPERPRSASRSTASGRRSAW